MPQKVKVTTDDGQSVILTLDDGGPSAPAAMSAAGGRGTQFNPDLAKQRLQQAGPLYPIAGGIVGGMVGGPLGAGAGAAAGEGARETAGGEDLSPSQMAIAGGTTAATAGIAKILPGLARLVGASPTAMKAVDVVSPRAGGVIRFLQKIAPAADDVAAGASRYMPNLSSFKPGPIPEAPGQFSDAAAEYDRLAAGLRAKGFSSAAIQKILAPSAAPLQRIPSAPMPAPPTTPISSLMQSPSFAGLPDETALTQSIAQRNLTGQW